MQIYDLLLEAALEAQQCGPRRLQVTDQWEWLLTEFAETYGIRDTYARLAHLRWVVRCQHMPARVMPAHASVSASHVALS